MLERGLTLRGLTMGHNVIGEGHWVQVRLLRGLVGANWKVMGNDSGVEQAWLLLAPHWCLSDAGRLILREARFCRHGKQFPAFQQAPSAPLSILAVARQY